MDQESDLQPADEGLPQRDLEHASDFDTEVVREEKEPRERLREALEAWLGSMEVPWIKLEEAVLERARKEEGHAYRAPAFYSDIRDEDIVNMPRGGLHALFKEKSLPDIPRDKIKGELACIEVKGKAAATSSYDTGESSTNTSPQSSPIRTEICQSSELDHVSIPPAPPKFSVVADHGKCAGTSANTSRSSLNDHTQGTTVSTGSGSPESTVQRYPLPHPPLTASRNEQARLHEATAKCRDNHNVGRAGTTVYSSEPMAPCQQPAAFAPTGADIEAGRFGTTMFSSEPKAPYLQSAAYALAGADIGAGRAGTTVFSLEPTAPYQQSAAYPSDGVDIEVGRAGTTVFSSEPMAHYLRSAAYAPAGADIEAGRAGTTMFSSEPIAHYLRSAAYVPAGADIEAGRAGTTMFSSEPTAHSQQSAVYAPASADIGAGRAGTTVFSSEPMAHYQQSPAYAPIGADIEARAFTTCSEPPPETIAIFKEPPVAILIAGAFALLSRNPETFRGPVERVLLGVMTVGFICSFMWPLMGGRRRMAGVSSLLQWTAVWAMFVAFFLIMTLLITH